MQETASVTVLACPKLTVRTAYRCFVARVLLNIAQFVDSVRELAFGTVFARPEFAERFAQLCFVEALAKVVPRVAVPLMDAAAALGLCMEVCCAVALVCALTPTACIPTLLRAASAAVVCSTLTLAFL